MFALEGIRVLDLSRLAPGPFCTMLLGDMGADVLLIEPPPSRLHAVMGVAASGDEERRSAAYNAFGRNKRSMILDLQTDEGRRIFYRLADTADVVLEGFRPGVVRRLAVDYETVRKVNPAIVYCSLSGYGQDGPYAGLVGHDINYISIGGALGMIGWPDTPPAIPSNVIGDFAAGGLQAAYGILLALLARERTGKGQYVDIAMSDGVLQLLAVHVSDYFRQGAVPAPGSSALNGGQPNYNVYECKDGKWISLGSLEPHFFANLCRFLGGEEFIEHRDDPAWFPDMRSHFAQRFRTRTRDEWFEAMRGTDLCVAPVYSLDEALADPHNRHRQMVVDVKAPGLGVVQQVGISVKLSETPGRVRQVAPLAGQQTDAVLEGLGYGAAEIAGLREREVVA